MANQDFSGTHDQHKLLVDRLGNLIEQFYLLKSAMGAQIFKTAAVLDNVGLRDAKLYLDINSFL